MERPPISISVTFFLILLNAAFWLVFAIIAALGVIHSIAGLIRWVMVTLALGTSVTLAGTVIFLKRRNRFAFYFGVILLAIIAILSITDEFGPPDLFTLLISLAGLGLMLKDRAWYLQSGDSPPSGTEPH
jgi:hypothetical protein